MVKCAKNREIAIRYNDQGFGKRPDVLEYPNDVIELAKQGASSFHTSEEHWDNPLLLNPNMKKQEINDLRIGWDLVLDIDCKIWKYSKLITHLLVQELKEHGIKSISVKFSGNKGMHIAVPFKAFPKKVHEKETRLLFPEGVRRIAAYLRDKIEPKLFNLIEKDNIEEYIIKKIVCSKCGKEKKQEKNKPTIEFVCPSCNNRIKAENEKFMQCEKCKVFMDKFENKKQDICIYCNNKTFKEYTDISNILDIDTVLISSRHLYRSVYSLHEKSSLASIPVDINNILNFEKDMAKIENITEFKEFLDDKDTKEGEATNLILQAFDHKPKIQVEEKNINVDKKFDIPTEAIPVDLFPPCIKAGLNGLEDGKKRFMFCLKNFLSSCGYNHDEIAQIFNTWNDKNPEPLREVIINGQLRYHKIHKKIIMPPNCNNNAYYKDLQICHPDNLCQRIKNPVQYATRKAYVLNKEKQESKGRPKLTEEQKEARRKYREKLKEKKESEKKDNGDQQK